MCGWAEGGSGGGEWRGRLGRFRVTHHRRSHTELASSEAEGDSPPPLVGAAAPVPGVTDLENLTIQSADVEGGGEPILFTFGPYGYVRYRCPLDQQPMENRTREFSTFGVGTFRCLGGHEWKHDTDRLWTREEEAALAQNLVEVGESLDQSRTALDRLEALLNEVAAAEVALGIARDRAFDEVLALFPVPADTAVA